MPQIMNPAVSEKRALLSDLMILAEAAAMDVQMMNPSPLANVTISKASIADLIAASESGHTSAEHGLYAGIIGRLAQTAADLAALPLMIESA